MFFILTWQSRIENTQNYEEYTDGHMPERHHRKESEKRQKRSKVLQEVWHCYDTFR